MIKRLFVLCLMFILCNANAASRYLFTEYPLSVIKPSWITDMNVYSDKQADYESVEFMTGRGFWMVDGAYSVQIFPHPASIYDKNSFYRESEVFFKHFMLKDREQTLPHLKWISAKRLIINDYPAYQAISLDKESEPAGIFVSTSIYMKDALAVVSYIGPFDIKNKHRFESQIPWSKYNQFVRSIK